MRLDPLVHGSVTLIKHLAPDTRSGVLVGVFRGIDAEVLLTKLPELHLTLVDNWSLCGVPNAEDFDTAEIRAEAHGRLDERFAGRIRWLEIDSLQASLNAVVSMPFDFVYIDGDHDQQAVERDIRWWMAAVKPPVREQEGGLMAGHDYGHPDFPGVHAAVDSLLPAAEIDGTVWMWRRR